MSSDDATENIISKIVNPNVRNSESNIYGEDFYNNPFTNPEYEKTLQSLNIDKFIYDLAAKGTQAAGGKTLIATAKSLPFMYEGHNVIIDNTLIQNLTIDASQGMETPQFFSEPGYLISFRLAANDPLMSLKVYAKGLGETGFTIADYSLQKMAVLGMGMTQGEAEETYYNEEGETSRDISGQPSQNSPYLVRYKHLPTGTQTDYDLYKGTNDDIWIVAAYAPKLIPKFNTLFFDVFNANQTGPRLVHYLEISRMIIIQERLADKVPEYSRSILSLPIPAGDPVAEAATASSSYTTGRIKKITNNPFMTNPSSNIYSINKEQQNESLFNDIMDVNHEMFKDMIDSKFQEKKRLRKSNH